jgi:Phage portal protein
MLRFCNSSKLMTYPSNYDYNLPEETTTGLPDYRLTNLVGWDRPNKIDIYNDNFNASFTRKRNPERVEDFTPKQFRQWCEQQPLFAKALEKVSDGVALLPWTVYDHKNKDDSDVVDEKIIRIEASIENPNFFPQGTYFETTKKAIKDLLIFGTTFVERQPGITNDPKANSFSWYSLPAEDLVFNPEWEPHIEGLIPQFYYYPQNQWGKVIYEKSRAYFSENIFMIQHRVSNGSLSAMSPAKLAYKEMCEWSEARNYQNRVASNPVRDYLICLKDGTQEELELFRSHWRNNVTGTGKHEIVSGDIDIKKLGAKTVDDLMLEFTNYLANIIALCFNIDKRDFGVDPHDNRATLDTASDRTFQESILPVSTLYLKALSTNLVNYYQPGYAIKISDTEPRKESEEASVARDLFKENIITKDEARRRVKENPLPPEVGNKFADGKSMDGKNDPQQPTS